MTSEIAHDKCIEQSDGEFWCVNTQNFDRQSIDFSWSTKTQKEYDNFSVL